MTKTQKLKIIFIACVLSLVAAPVFAAELFFDAKTTRARIGEILEVEFFVDTQKENTNAFEGKILFSKDILDLKEIRDGNSIVNFWLDKPAERNGIIYFSGITPGGFLGDNGLLFSVVFETKKEGAARFEINGARILLNNGIGSAAVLATSSFEIAVSEGMSINTPAFLKIEDNERPESFLPETAKDETLFGGKWFVVFVAQDKASGIDHYEILETRNKIQGIWSKKWQVVESPHVLRDQELRSFVFVKAVDKAGNYKIVKIEPRDYLAWYKNYENWIIIIILIIVAVVLFWIGKKKNKKFKLRF